MARPLPPVSPCAPWLCSGISTPTGLARAATTRLVALRSTTSMVSSITPTGSTTCSSPPPRAGENYEPRNPMESEIIQARNRRRRDLRQTLQDRSRTVDALLAAQRGDLHVDDQMRTDDPAITRETNRARLETPRLKRYINE